MTSQENRKAICPESTIESAPRRDFIKKAAWTTVAAGIGGTLLAKGAVLPESTARSDAGPVEGCSPSGIGVSGSGLTGVSGDGSPSPCAPCCTPVGVQGSVVCGIGVLGYADTGVPLVSRGSTLTSSDLQQWQGFKCCSCAWEVLSVVDRCGHFGIGTSSPTTALEVKGETLSLTCTPGPAICAQAANIGISGAATGRCTSSIGIMGTSHGTGVKGLSCYFSSPVSPSYGGCKPGVCGTSHSGPGVQGNSVSGIGVLGVASTACATPVVARGASGQTANLQQWEASCGAVYAVINKAGSLGLGGVTNPHHVLCISGKAHASSGFSIGPCVCVNTTLAVNGSMAAKTRAVSASTTLLMTDYAILASGTITLTLPPAKTQNGMMIFIKNTSTSTVSVVPGGTDTIEGSSTARTLTKQYDSLQLISNGSNEWYILSGAKCGALIT